jgi:membrane fusion protein (multidrug efflux system)
MAEEQSAPAPASRRPWILAVVVVALAAGGFFLWQHLNPSESTDDAQVAGHVDPVATRVGGTIKAIRVEDNQIVKTGDVLVEIDPRDYEIALQKAEADLAAAEAAASAARTGVPITSTTSKSEMHSAETGTANAQAAADASAREVDASKAKVTSAQARVVEAKANATRAQQDLERLKPLAAKDEIPKQQFDAAVAAAAAMSAAADSAAAAVAEAEANLAVSQSKVVQAQGVVSQAQEQAKAASTAPQQIALTQAQATAADAQVKQAQAAVDMAKLNLDRTTVRSPANGIVSRRTAEMGQVVQAGQPLLAITSLDTVWITANFKETQLRSMQPGQRANVSVDAYGKTFTAKVDSIAAATGATFSLLPPDNASGNYVKVVQRVPVKIVLDAGQDGAGQLRPGMSVDATVYVK